MTEISYHCEAFEEDGRRIGGFEVRAETMGAALEKASKNIEVRIRPTQFEMRVKVLKRAPKATPVEGELVGASR